MFRFITQYLRANPQRIEDAKWAARFGTAMVIFAIFLYMMLIH
jgi:hypothetical protein